MFNYTAPDQLLKDKIILVTGAGDGIGKTAAITYAEYGATVILIGRTTKKLEATYDAIEAKGYPQAAIVPLNLDSATEHDFNELAATLKNEFGRLDGILHNASLLGERTSLADYTPDVFDQVMRVNVSSQFKLTKAILPLLQESLSASIVFTSSSVGRKGRAYWGAYSVSKFATEGMMQVFADELGTTSHIRSNSINPGGTRTSMRASAYPAEDPQTLPTPADIMPIYLYLMGEDSKTINGQAFDAQA